MLRRSYDARHRAGHETSSRPGLLVAGLALPTAAALALTFGTTGAAVATSGKPQAVASEQFAAPSSDKFDDTVRSDAVQAQAAARLGHVRAVQAGMAVIRARAVARSEDRKRLEVAGMAQRAALAHGWQLPITHPVKTSGFGYRWGRLHAGEDFAVSVGTPLAAMSTGTVAYAGPESGFGNLVKIRYWDGTISYYGHMSSVSVTVGQGVEPGQIVGFSGNTGHSTGPHLHLEIHPDGGQAVDPLPWLATHNIAS